MVSNRTEMDGGAFWWSRRPDESQLQRVRDVRCAVGVILVPAA